MSHCKCSVETCSPSCGECGNPIKDCSPFSSRAAGEMPGAVAELIKDSKGWIAQCVYMKHGTECGDCESTQKRIAAVESLYPRAGQEETK